MGEIELCPRIPTKLQIGHSKTSVWDELREMSNERQQESVYSAVATRGLTHLARVALVYYIPGRRSKENGRVLVPSWEYLVQSLALRQVPWTSEIPLGTTPTQSAAS